MRNVMCVWSASLVDPRVSPFLDPTNDNEHTEGTFAIYSLFVSPTLRQGGGKYVALAVLELTM